MNFHCGGQPFYAGEAAFGYFKGEALVDQVGLDRGNSPAPLAHTLSAPIKLRFAPSRSIPRAK